jgi:hypothetical protein
VILVRSRQGFEIVDEVSYIINKFLPASFTFAQIQRCFRINFFPSLSVRYSNGPSLSLLGTRQKSAQGKSRLRTSQGCRSTYEYSLAGGDAAPTQLCIEFAK